MHGIDYVETGRGAAVLFIPGSYSTHAAWRPIQKLLSQPCRFIGTSLCGYGSTPETRTRDDDGIAHEVRVIEAAARRAGGPVHLVGHSFGGTVALAAALSGSVNVASLTLFEANPLALLRRSMAALYRGALETSHVFAAAVAAGDPDAPGLIIDFWGGDQTFAMMPESVRSYCRESAPANVLDWGTDFGFDPSTEAIAALDLPVLLVRGALANPAMVAMTDLLQQLLPRSRPKIVESAGHFLISTHAPECAALLEAFLRECTTLRQPAMQH